MRFIHFAPWFWYGSDHGSAPVRGSRDRPGANSGGLADNVRGSDARNDIRAPPSRGLPRKLHRRPRCLLFGERKNAQDAPHAHFALLAIDKVAKRTDIGAHATGSAEELHHTERSSLGVVLGSNAVPAPFLTYMFAQ